MSIVFTNVTSALKDFYIHEMNKPDEFKIDKIIKPVPVMEITDNYYEFRNNYKVKDWKDYVLGEDARPKRVEPVLSTKTYYCNSFSAETFVSRKKLEVAASQNRGLDFRQNMMTSVIHTMKMVKELQGVDVLTDATNYASANTYQGPDIADYQNSEPIREIHLAAEKCKKRANTVAMSRAQATILMDHWDFTKRIKSGIVLPDEEILSSILDLNVVIFDAKKDTADEGITESMSYIFPYDKIWVGYVDPNPVPAMQIPSFAYSFVWEASNEGSEMGFQVRVREDPNDVGLKGGEWIKLIHSRDMKVVGVNDSGLADYGVLLTNVWDGVIP